MISNLTSPEYADDIRSHIEDNATSTDPKTYGGVFINKNDNGTAHVSIIAENGDAVAVTSTINL